MRIFDQMKIRGFADPSTLLGAVLYAIILAFVAWFVGRTLRVAIRPFRRMAVLLLNPDSAGPKRFHLPVSVALLRVMGKKVEARLVELRT